MKSWKDTIIDAGLYETGTGIDEEEWYCAIYLPKRDETTLLAPKCRRSEEVLPGRLCRVWPELREFDR
jgi:hypothetical protein